MKFKELEVYGFKSFADKLQVKFTGGVTAIVGPNGCGKSNVADAIRWVLGEQSARLLRGKNMQDVIFSGTEKRKSLSYCEVMLTFDNCVTESGVRLFPTLDYNEVSISRKLYRSNESFYFINGNQCRLKEITDLLFDAGMGREGYSIIGQGRIDEILSARPENRRAIFEEAAGIAKFKARKSEAERKLSRTRENLVRIEDILAEKSRQLEPLTAAAEKARKYLDLRDKLKEHEINIYIYQRDTAEQAKSAISKRLDGVSDELELKEKEYEALVAEYKRTLDKYESSDADLLALHEELTVLTVGLEKQAGEINSLRQKQEFLRENAAKTAAENSALAQSIKEYDEQMSEARAARSLSARALEAENAGYAQAQNEYLNTAAALTESYERIESERKAELEAMDKLSEIKSNLSGLTTERQMLQISTREQDEQKKELLARLKAAESLLITVSEESDDILARWDAARKSMDELTGRYNETKFTLNKITDELSNLSGSYHSASARYKLLKQIKESREDFASGVRNLLNAAEDDKNVKAHIEGVLAELITVDKKYETAIEIALGGAYQNVVVSDEAAAGYLIDFLKQSRLGRVTFIPVTAAKPRRIAPEYAHILKRSGVCGVASSLIAFDARYKDVIDGYLGGTLIAEDKETASAIARETRSAFRIVTLDGELFAADGSITGGSLKADRSAANVFSHERELKELETRVETLETRIKYLTEQKTKGEQILASVDADMKTRLKDIHALELSSTAKTEILSQHTAEKDAAEAALNDLAARSQRDVTRLEEIERDLSSVSKLEEFLATSRKRAGESGLEQSAAIDELRKQSEELREKTSQIRIEINRLENEAERLDSDIIRLEKAAAEARMKHAAGAVMLENAESQIRAAENLILELSKKSTEADTERIKEIRAKIAGIDEYKKQASARISELDSMRDSRSDELQKLRDKKTEYAFQLQSVDTDIEVREQKLMEDYNLTYELCLPFKLEGYDYNKGSAEAARLKRSIFNLGDVNVGAIEQSKVAFEEYNQYMTGRDDLVKGENDLNKIIKDLSADMIKIFNENFEKIRVSFVKIFKELFDGGTADLILTEPEEGCDELSRGIDIVAQPPQKKLQSISLLSGGERALTAIAILFAILKLRPMPFCVLDEIEAALDDANAFRFAKYLRRFSEDTQFIVITHRKPTMELSDNLYGVTMEEKGVSKVVSVKLSDVNLEAGTIGA